MTIAAIKTTTLATTLTTIAIMTTVAIETTKTINKIMEKKTTKPMTITNTTETTRPRFSTMCPQETFSFLDASASL